MSSEVQEEEGWVDKSLPVYSKPKAAKDQKVEKRKFVFLDIGGDQVDPAPTPDPPKTTAKITAKTTAKRKGTATGAKKGTASSVAKSSSKAKSKSKIVKSAPIESDDDLVSYNDKSALARQLSQLQPSSASRKVPSTSAIKDPFGSSSSTSSPKNGDQGGYIKHADDPRSKYEKEQAQRLKDPNLVTMIVPARGSASKMVNYAEDTDEEELLASSQNTIPKGMRRKIQEKKEKKNDDDFVAESFGAEPYTYKTLDIDESLYKLPAPIELKFQDNPEWEASIKMVDKSPKKVEIRDGKQTCPVGRSCSSRIPLVLSTRLQAAFDHYKNVKEKHEVGLGNSDTVMFARDRFCFLHKAEETVIPNGIKQGYLEEIDYYDISRRLKKSRTRLDKIISGEVSSSFWKNVLDQLAPDDNGVRPKVSDVRLFLADQVQCGYYGPTGQTWIFKHLCDTFKINDSKSIPISKIKPLSLTDFIELVLTPEAALILIAEDLKRNLENAKDLKHVTKVLHKSVEFGKAIHNQDMDNEIFQV